MRFSLVNEEFRLVELEFTIIGQIFTSRLGCRYSGMIKLL